MHNDTSALLNGCRKAAAGSQSANGGVTLPQKRATAGCTSEAVVNEIGWTQSRPQTLITGKLLHRGIEQCAADIRRVDTNERSRTPRKKMVYLRRPRALSRTGFAAATSHRWGTAPGRKRDGVRCLGLRPHCSVRRAYRSGSGFADRILSAVGATSAVGLRPRT